MRKTANRIAGAARKFFFPNRCLACGNLHPTGPETKPEDHPSSDFGDLTAAYLCKVCRNGYTPVQSPICPMCGLAFKSREGTDHLCQSCAVNPKYFHQARACGHYSGPLMKVIHRIKYSGDIQLAEPLGRLLYSAFTAHFQSEDIDLVLPVPLHRTKFRQRGFNQSYLFIKNWNGMVGSENHQRGHFRIARDALIRTRPTVPQTELGRAERLANIRKAFQVVAPHLIRDRRILLVDDVYTTGATVNECAGVLLKHHARRIDVLTLARAMSPS